MRCHSSFSLNLAAILLAALGFLSSSAHAESAASQAKPVASATSSLSDTQVEERLHLLSAELRCLVCQNESLASSRAPLAEDLRREVREQIRSGKSNPQIVSYLTDRYGDFVTYRPPWSGKTLLLWLGPLLLLILAVGMFIKGVLKKKPKDIPAIEPDADELARLRQEFK
ncbi:cytochrome c-type biogenesis protein CcmH [Chitinibacter sp. SCUT-21]|uniref:cytochrome c-type biogenesis protein n=1 Tax=Chitinibacter sp. SCUT-21 TaxID=2970891 RepID=UPI0035A7415B